MADLRAFLIKLNKNLNILKEREAKYSSNVPIEVLNQIEDHEQAIALTEQAVNGELNETEWREMLEPLLVVIEGRTGEAASSVTIGDVKGGIHSSLIAGRDIIVNIYGLGGKRTPLKIPWTKVKNICKTTSTPRLNFIAQRFDTDLYVHRQEPQRHIDHFLNQSNRNYFVLVGDSGTGKSAFLWGLEKQLQENPAVACLFCDASSHHLKGKHSVVEALLQDLARVLQIPPEDTLHAIKPNSEQPPERLVFMVDAINEFERMQDMEILLRDFHALVPHFPWLRLIISCRPHFWRRINEQKGAIGIADRYFYKSDDSGKPFHWLGKLNDEEVGMLYEKHRNKYKFEPKDYNELDPNVQKRLRDPLMLWLISEICSRQDISGKSDLILVDVKAIPEYVRILRERGDSLMFPDDERFLRQTLPKFFVREGICHSYVARNQVVEFSTRTNINDILRRLINCGILKEDSGQRLSFSFERYFGYFIGSFLRQAIQTGKSFDC